MSNRLKEWRVLFQKVRSKAKEYGADPDMIEALYREMISRFVQMEMKEYIKINLDSQSLND